MIEAAKIRNPKANIFVICIFILATIYAPMAWSGAGAITVNVVFIVVCYLVGCTIGTKLFPDEDESSGKAAQKQEETPAFTPPEAHGFVITHEQNKDLMWFNRELMVVCDDYIKTYGSVSAWKKSACETGVQQLVALESRKDDILYKQQLIIQFIESQKEISDE